MAYPGKSARLSESATATLPLLAYLALAIGLMVADHRAGLGVAARRQFAVVSAPLWWLAAAPSRVLDFAGEQLRWRSSIEVEDRRLREALEIASARLNRMNAVAAENQRLRQLLGGTRGYQLNVRMVDILDVDLDPYRQRLVLAAGSLAGVRVGQALIDAGGVMGQVIETSPTRSVALLVTDPDHAVPVQVARTGLRAIAYGAGGDSGLTVPNIPRSVDVKAGDLMITSGIGGRFPAGFPVGVVTALRPDGTGLFVVAEVRPTSHLDRGVEVLLVSNLAPTVDAGPPLPARARPAATASDPEKSAEAATR